MPGSQLLEHTIARREATEEEKGLLPCPGGVNVGPDLLHQHGLFQHCFLPILLSFT